MRTLLLYVLLLATCFPVQSQEQGKSKEKKQEVTKVSGTVQNAADDRPLEGVHIINLSKVKASVTNENGEFSLAATVNDTLYLSYIGFKALRVRVTNDWIKYGAVKVKMTELGIALEEVIVADIQLTGYLEIDAKNIPIYDNYRYRIPGQRSGYEAGSKQPRAAGKVVDAIFNPANFLYNAFGKRPKELRNLRKMKKDDEIKNLLENKFDRATLMALLQIDKLDIDEILRQCNYSADFINFANDLQILDAISSCYEEYKILQRKKK